MKVALTDSPPAWSQLRLAQNKRVKGARHALEKGPLPKSDDARRFWSQRAWSELAAVPAVSQVVLALTREGAGLQTLGAYTAIAADEVRHALLSRDLADRLGGYVDEVPEGLDYGPRGLAQPSDAPVVVWALANGCFSETVSLELIRARYAATQQPVVKALLAETLRDEAVHVRVAWQLAEELLPRLPAGHRRELAEYGVELGQMLTRTFGTAGLRGKVLARERRLRTRTAEQGLGSLTPDAEDALVKAALQSIDERLVRLGLPARRISRGSAHQKSRQKQS